MNLDHLYYFETMARLQNYTKAAQSLNITQPTLSNAIKNLESELNVPLFEKKGRNVELTIAGSAFQKDIQYVLKSLDKAILKIQSMQAKETLKITGLRVLSTAYIPNIIKEYIQLKDNENLDIRFCNADGMSETMLEGLLDYKYDIAFCSKIPNFDEYITYSKVAIQDIVLITPIEHNLNKYDSVMLEQTTSYKQIAFSKRSGVRRIIDREFIQKNLLPDYIMEIDEDETIAGLVSEGFGIAIIPKFPFLENMNLNIINISDLEFERTFYMCYRENDKDSEIISEFISFVEDKPTYVM